MNPKNLKILALIIAALAVVYYLIGNNDGSSTEGNVFIPGLKEHLNDTTSLGVRSHDGAFTIARGDGWVISERDNYPADVGALRELLIALADARVIEIKTSNPENYAVLGVDDPADEDSSAIELSIRGEGFEHGVILGKTAQRSYRYARLVGSEQSVMIDKNPDVSAEVGGWLMQDLLDIASSRISAVTIAHADGERLEIVKGSPEAANFDVVNLPEGRELSYATVANGIAGALAGLKLEDVRRAVEGTAPSVVTRFETFDGLTISVASFGTEDEPWIAVDVEASPDAADDDGAAEPATTAADAAESTDTDTPEDDAVEEEAGRNVADEAADIAARTAGWQFRIASYKANLLKRRFDDILKAETEAGSPD